MSSYSHTIRTVEESLRLLEIQIENLKKSETTDKSKLDHLIETKDRYLTRLRELRRAEYDESQHVDYGDDR